MKCFHKCAYAFFIYTAVIAIVFSALLADVLGLLVLAEYITDLLGLHPNAAIYIYFIEIAMLIAATIIIDHEKICD